MGNKGGANIMGLGVDVLDEVRRQMLKLRVEHRAPQSIRLGAKDWDAVLSVVEPLTGATDHYRDGKLTLYGVPVQVLPIPHMVSVV